MFISDLQQLIMSEYSMSALFTLKVKHHWLIYLCYTTLAANSQTEPAHPCPCPAPLPTIAGDNICLRIGGGNSGCMDSVYVRLAEGRCQISVLRLK